MAAQDQLELEPTSTERSKCHVQHGAHEAMTMRVTCPGKFGHIDFEGTVLYLAQGRRRDQLRQGISFMSIQADRPVE